MRGFESRRRLLKEVASSDSARDLLTRGIAAAKAGSKEEANFYLEWVLRTEGVPDVHLEAWWWLSQVSDDPARKRSFLEEILARNPSDPRARRALAILDGRLKPESIVDTDKIPGAQPEPDQEARAERFTCPRCGGRLTAAQQGSTLLCAYCGWRRELASVRPESSLPGNEFVVAMAAARAHLRPQSVRMFRCLACAAPYQLAPETISLTCAHCGSNYVVKQFESEELIQPDGVIPFRIARREAAHALAADGRRRPDSMEADMAGNRLVGVYFPMWCFELSGQVRWSGMRYDGYRKDWVPTSGSELVLERDYLVAASPRFSAKWQRRALVFDLKDVQPFEPAFLTDWPAETYQTPMSDAALAAHAEVFQKIRQRSNLGAPERVRDVRFDPTGFTIDSFRLLLAPVWSEHSAGATVRGIVNGQTGAVGLPSAPRGWLARLLGAD